MKKSICILLTFLIGTFVSVTASPKVTVKPHLAAELVVSKTSNEVVINVVPSVAMAFNYEASEVIIYCNLATPAIEVGAEVKASFAENRTVTRSSNINLNKPLKTEKIYLLNCSIRQCGFGALNRSVC